MVYDGTKSGLNGSIWAPWFALPTIETHLHFVGPDSFMGDMDIGDMFHNFMLHEDLRKVAGIDLTPFFPEELVTKGNLKLLWDWERCAMGLRSSPYNAIQGILFAEEVVKGNSLDVNNIFRWDEVQLNLPGDPNYKPWLPWVCKIPLSDGKVACDFVIYVDDVRSCGNSWAEGRLASRSIASRMNWLGLQDVVRKRRDPCQDPGPWAGSVIHTNHGVVTVSVTQDRWTKAVGIISWIAELIKHSADIEFKKLESYRGYLVYLSRTYPILTPYLKGIHLTLDSWRPCRKSDGWKLTLSEIRLALEENGQEPHRG
jgi:hypothetical protein